MRKVRFPIFIALLINITPCISQSNSGTITGVVSTTTGFLDKITVQLLDSKDSSIIKFTITDNKGRFEFNNLSSGNYFLKITSVGLETYWSSLLNYDGRYKELAPIKLQSTSKTLSSIEITSKRDLIDVRSGKIIINVDASATNTGSSALEILEKSPGVTIDKDGKITLKGKQNVMVLIDGKNSYLSESELSGYLKSMNSSQLDQIEIMTNPPAKYEASGNAGIINIKTKKLKGKGLNIVLNNSFSQGVYTRNNTGLNLNYKKDRLNLFSSMNCNLQNDFQQFSLDRDIYETNPVSLQNVVEQRAFFKFFNKTFNYKLGGEYNFNPNNTFSITTTNYHRNSEINNSSTNYLLDYNHQLISTNYGHSSGLSNINNYNLNATYRNQFDSAGSDFLIDASLINYHNAQDQFLNNSIYDKSDILISKPDSVLGNLPSGFKVYALKFDITKHLRKNSLIEGGYKMSYVKSNNDIHFDSVIEQNLKPDLNRSSKFIYTERIYAGYVSLHFKLYKNLKMQSGVRYETSAGRGSSLSSGKVFTKQFGQFFPNLNLSFDADKNHIFNISYSKRLFRPKYRDLDPSVILLDKYAYQVGNPQLSPEFTDNIELSHLFKNELTSTVNYTYTKDVAVEVFEIDPLEKLLKLIKRNFASYTQIGLSVNFQKALTKLLTVSINTNVYNNQYKGFLNDSIVFLKATSAKIDGTFDLSLKKDWNLSINGFYNSSGFAGVEKILGSGMISLGASKILLKGKGKLSANIHDFLNLQSYTAYNDYGNIRAIVHNLHYDNRYLALTFTYRLGKTNSKKINKESSSADEQKRMGA